MIVVGAGLPHLPAVLSASKSYSERLFRYARIDRLERAAADAALSVPAGEEDAAFEPDALAEMYAVTGGYPYFIQAYGKVVWDLAPSSPITVDDVRVATPDAEAELAVGFFGSRYERATPAERDYLRAMAAVALVDADGDPVGAPKDSGEAEAYDRRRSRNSTPYSPPMSPSGLGKQPQSLSPARDALLKKGLDLLHRTWPRRLHRPALRPLSARPPMSHVSVNGEPF